MTDTDTLREAVATHYPTGPWKQPCGNYVLPCSCGEDFWGHNSEHAKAKWSFHAEAALATLSKPEPAAVGEEAAMSPQDYWRAVAKSAGEHGVRYRTNRALERFLADEKALRNPGDVERFAIDLEHGDFTNVAFALNQRMCCDGHMCGCQGSTVGQYLAHELRALYASPVPSGGEELLRSHFKCAVDALRIYDPAIADAIQQNYELHASPSSEAISPPDARAVVEAVTQEDRDRANEWRLAFMADGDNFGQQALEELAQDFARHRIDALQSGASDTGEATERRRIVAWLRSHESTGYVEPFDEAANAIESCAHLTQSGASK